MPIDLLAQSTNQPIDLLDGTGQEQDGALKQGYVGAKSSLATTKALGIGDFDEAARLAAERAAYAKANPGSKEGNELSQAWESGDGIGGGIANVASEFAKDWNEADGVIEGVKATGKNLSAMGSGIVKQIPNMVLPMGGMLAGGAAGSAVAPGVGTVAGAWAGASAGNTAMEAAGQVDQALQQAGIDPNDTAAVSAFLKENGASVLGKSAIKGGIIGAVDTATMGVGSKLLTAPAKAAAEKVLIDAGVDITNKAAVSAAKQNPVIGNAITAAVEATEKGAAHTARNVTAAALEPGGEFAGEYLGEGVANNNWDEKNAFLEAASSVGQSAITFAGQKAYQAATSPLRRVVTDPTTGADVEVTPEAGPLSAALNTTAATVATPAVAADPVAQAEPIQANETLPIVEETNVAPSVETEQAEAQGQEQRPPAELTHATPYSNPRVEITEQDRIDAAERNAAVFREIEAFAKADPENGTIEGILRQQEAKKEARRQQIEATREAHRKAKEQANVAVNPAPVAEVATPSAEVESGELPGGASNLESAPVSVDESVPFSPAVADPSVQPVEPAGNANAPSVEQFDVSGRTDAQLAHLVDNGKPGWKEAAIAEVAKRAAQPVADVAPTVPDVAPVQAAAPKESPVKVRTVSGDSVYVNQSEIDSGKTMIRMRDKNGNPKQGESTVIHRENLDPAGEKQKALNAEFTPDIIMLKGGRTYASAAAAKQGAKKNGITETHEVIPASEVAPGTKGFVLRKKAEPVEPTKAALPSLTYPSQPTQTSALPQQSTAMPVPSFEKPLTPLQAMIAKKKQEKADRDAQAETLKAERKAKIEALQAKAKAAKAAEAAEQNPDNAVAPSGAVVYAETIQAKDAENDSSTPRPENEINQPVAERQPGNGETSVRGATPARAGIGRNDDRGVRGTRGRPDGSLVESEDLGDGGRAAPIHDGPHGVVARDVQRVSADFRPGLGGLTREGSWFDSAKRNIDLIELAIGIEKEGRNATPEEQALLSKYVGFGASEIRNPLFPVPNSWQKQQDPTRLVWPDLVREARWKPLAERIEALPREWQESILQSTQYAHYTSEGIIRSVWSAIQRLGFTGGKIFEPGTGIGSFAMLMPDSVHATSKYVGVEFDAPTALIARLLSPDQNIQQGDFIKRKFPKNFFDVNVGNPPFSQTKILGDPEYAKKGFMLHDFFFAKGIDLVRPGGLQVFVTSKGTMDKQSDKARKYLSERADLVGAVRLPSTAFEGNAGTSVVTDVIFLRKRAPGEAPAGESWGNLQTVETPDGNVVINEYFANHPDMVLGQNRISGNTDDMGRRINSNGRDGEKYTVVSYDASPADLDSKFAAAIERFPENVYSTLSQPAESVKEETKKIDFDPTIKREGVIYLAKDGSIMRVKDGVGVALESSVKLSDKDKAWFKSYVGLRDSVQEARLAQVNEAGWEAALKKLNKEYAAFVKAHGPIREYTTTTRKSTDAEGNIVETQTPKYKNRRLYREDYDSALLTSLEDINEAGDIVKAPFLLWRTIGQPVQVEIKSVGDALAVSLDSIGKLDLDDLARKMNISRDEAIEALGNQVYQSPEGAWLLADEYLSGDVVAKLEEAIHAAEHNPALMRNVEALKEVQPEKLGPTQISAKLGASWINAEHVNAFATEIGAGEVTFDHRTETWQVDGGNKRGERNAAAEYGTARRSPSELLEAILNSRSISVKYDSSAGKDLKGKTDETATTAANEMAKKIKDKFKGWVWTDVDRVAELVESYNKRFNNIAGRRFDGSHLSLPGVSLRFKLHPHQLRTIWRQVQTGNTYLAHAVGAGKTIEMIAGGMEQKRLGLIKKPMYVVPNHMLEQFSNEFMELYPLANIMVADDENFSTERRQAFIAAATLNSPDAIIITHSAFKRIGVTEASVKPIRDEILTDLEIELAETAAGNETRVRRSQLEQQIEAVKQRFDAIVNASGKDSTIKFEDIGVDFIYADEAHAFRKLDFHTAQSIKGIDPNGSQTAMDMYVKTRILEKQRPGRSFVFASGTPVTNTMGELFTIMRFFSPEELAKGDIATFDAWARQFGEVRAALEPNAAGRYELIERFAKFDNVPELMSRVRQFMDVLTSDNLGALVKRPDLKGGKPNLNIVPSNEALKGYMEGELAKRIEISKAWKPSKDQPSNPDPIVAIITDGRFAALDPRFFGGKLEGPSIITEMGDKVAATYHATKNNVYYDKDGKANPIKGSTQLVFYNLGFGEQSQQSRGFNSRAAFTKRLTDGGIPRNEIAWFDDANTDAKKESIFKAMRAGKLKVLIGSAKKMGTGVNVQNRLIELHYQDPPWFPADVEQPHGRIIRQGNLNKEVSIQWYSTKGTYQSTMWQMVARKQRFIDQAFTGDKNVRSMDDMGEASLFEQAAAVASGDPRAIQLAGLHQDVERLERLQAAHAQEQIAVHADLRGMEWSAKNARASIARLTQAFKAIGEQYFSFTSAKVGKAEYTKVGEFGQAVKDAFNKVAKEGALVHSDEPVLLATIGDSIKLMAEAQYEKNKPTGYMELFLDVAGLRMDIARADSFGDDIDATGLGRRIINPINTIDTNLRRSKEALLEFETNTVKLNKKKGAPFEHQQEMAEKYAELKQLEAELAAEGESAKQPQAVTTAINAEGIANTDPEAAGNQANSGRISQADQAIYGMAAEGQSATAILNHIASNSRNLFYRQVAKLLLKTEINPAVVAGTQTGWKMNAGEGKYAAAYNPKTDTVAMFRPASSERNVIHELIHAASIKALGKRGIASAQMKALFEHVKKTGKLKGMYGMTDVDEFMAEVFSNHKFQQALKKINAPSGSSVKTAWDWFIRTVRGILGLQPGSHDALSRALDIGVQVMRENMALKDEARGETRYAEGQKQTGTEAFRKWFGGSKVVDADGNPLVVYHGSPDVRGIFSSGFIAKNRGSVFFAAKDYAVADSYADDRRAFDYQNAEPQTIPLYLAIKNPLIIDAKGKFWRETERHVDEAKASGHDGIIINNSVDFYNNPRGQGKTTTVYAWFSPTQAKSAIDGQLTSRVDRKPIAGATGNNGDFDGSNPDIRYNIASDWYDDKAPNSVKSFVTNAFTSSESTSWVSAFNTQYHKAEKWASEGKPLFKKVFDLGQKFIGDTSRFGVMAQNAAPTLFHEIRSLADAKESLLSIRSIKDLTGASQKADIEAVATPLYEGTLSGGGSPLQGKRFSEAELRTKYQLTPRQIKLYNEALAAVNVSLNEMAKSIIAKHAKSNDVSFDREMSLAGMAISVKRALKQKIGDLGDAAADRLYKTIEDIDAIVEKNEALQTAGYFPLMRFGKHTVTAKDSQGNVQFFGMYDGAALIPNSGQYQANKVANEIRAEHPEWTVTTGINNTEKYKLYAGMNMEAVQLFAEHMDAESKEPFQEYLRQATNNRSVQKRLIHRKGTPGFDRDVRRTLAQFIVSNARSTSSSYHMGDMRQAAEAADQDGGDIGKEAVKLYQYVSEPGEEMQALRGYMFFNFLGGSIASAMVNLTQIPLMTFPFLSQYAKVGELAGMLASAAKLAYAVDKMPKALREAFEKAEMDGVTAPQEIHQLTATAANNIFSGSKSVNTLLRAWGAPFAMAESFNRRTTFIAAYQIAEKMDAKTLRATGHRTAFDFAENVVNQTQGIYNKGNRMNVGRGALGATLMTFKQYSIMYLELLKRLPPKQQLLMIGLLLLGAGGGGLPFVEDVEDIIDTIGQWLGYATNSKRTVRNAVASVLGDKAGDVAINGAASQMGIDLHSRFGMQNLLPGTGLMKMSSVDKTRDVTELFGPAASVINNVGNSIRNLATGNLDKAARDVLPNAATNAIKGAKMIESGYGEDMKGRRTIPVNAGEGLAKAVGFNPKSVADFGALKAGISQDQRMVQVKREEFTSAMADAILSGDTEAHKEAMLEMMRWNRDNDPSVRVVVNQAAVMARVRAARSEGISRFLKTVPKAMRQSAKEELTP